MSTQVEVQTDYQYKSDSNRLGLWLFIISDTFVFVGLLVNKINVTIAPSIWLSSGRTPPKR